MGCRNICVAGAAMVISSAASAQVFPVGPFTGDVSEGVEAYPFQQYPRLLTGLFEGRALVRGIGGFQGLAVINGVFSGGGCPLFARGGTKMLAATWQVQYEWEFDPPVAAWGGYFGTPEAAGFVTSIAVRFYDENRQLIGQADAGAPPCGGWRWGGWESAGAPIKFVQVQATGPFSGGVIALDDMEIRLAGACPCACGYDTTTGPNACDIFDFLGFQDRYAGADPCACDLDTTTGPGTCDVFDFLAFQNAFATGCP